MCTIPLPTPLVGLLGDRRIRRPYYLLMRSKVPPVAVEIFWALAFVVMMVTAPFAAKSTYESANGEWMARIVGYGRSPDMPMWAIFTLWCFVALLSITGTIACVILLVRRARGARGPSE